MITHRVRREEAASAPLVGRVLCSDLRDGDGRIALRKGAVLRPEDADRLRSLDWTELHLIEMEPGDVHEDEGGRTVAAVAAGKGVEARPLAGGAWPLVASWRGILEVETEVLRRINRIDGLALYSLFGGQVVEAGEMVARAKVIPLVTEGARIREAEALAGAAEGVVRVRPFLPMRVGAVVQENLGESGMARFHANLREKIAWFGSELLPPVQVPPEAAALADAVEGLLGRGAQLITVAGVKAMDPLDPAFDALGRLGVRLERLGVPAHPGSLFWMARLWEVPILGMPGCGLFSQATVFDLVLPRVLAGERVESADLAELGHGGLLTRDMTFRFPPYRAARERGAVE
jgi:hypothetical protein